MTKILNIEIIIVHGIDNQIVLIMHTFRARNIFYDLLYLLLLLRILETCCQLYRYENHDLAIARSSSSRADPGLRVAFKCLNI